MSSSPVVKKKPRPLVPGDAIGIVAPSSPFDRQKFNQGLTVLEDIGFTVMVPERIFEKNNYLAGTDTRRADSLNLMFKDPAVKGVFCARGGYGAIRILSMVDYDVISENPKMFIGCSDISVLLNTFYSRCGLVTLHGPMVESLSSASDQTKSALQDMLFDKSDLILPCGNPVVIRPGSAAGTVAGGNLTTLCHMAGTPYAPDFSGRILLLEDVGEAPYRIDRMLMHMKLAGCFEGVSGLMLGSFKGCGDPELIYQVFEDIFSKDRFPILAGFDIGHDEPNLTVPFGLEAVLDTDDARLLFSESPFAGG